VPHGRILPGGACVPVTIARMDERVKPALRVVHYAIITHHLLILLHKTRTKCKLYAISF